MLRYRRLRTPDGFTSCSTTRSGYGQLSPLGGLQWHLHDPRTAPGGARGSRRQSRSEILPDDASIAAFIVAVVTLMFCQRKALVRVGGDGEAVDAGRPGVGLEQRGQDSDDGGLAGAVGAEQGEDAARATSRSTPRSTSSCWYDVSRPGSRIAGSGDSCVVMSGTLVLRRRA
jgi:hypothetical protein